MCLASRVTLKFVATALCVLVSSFNLPALAEEKPDETIVVKGQVVDEAGKPVEGAEVFIPTSSFEEPYAATSDSDGRFELKLKSDFRAYRFCCIATTEDRSRQGFFRTEPQEQEIPDSVTITLKPAREIPVAVSDANGDPVAEADVLAISGFNQFTQTQTDDSGRATLLVPDGLLLESVAAIKDGKGLDYYLFQQRSRREKHPAHLAQEIDTAIAFTLAGARNVVVNVKDQTGKPVEGARVYPWYFTLPEKGGELNFSGYAPIVRYTDQQGSVSFPFIPANNERQLTFWGDKEDLYKHRREFFDPASLIDEVELVLPKLMPARGRVIDVDRQPVANAEIIAIGGSREIDQHRTNTTSDKDGNFELMLAPNHFYLFVASKDRLISPGQTLVVYDEPPGVELLMRLEPATRIFGQVTVGPENAAVPDQSIGLSLNPTPEHFELPREMQLPNPKDSNSAITPRHSQWTKTDDEGRYEFWAGPGKYDMFGPQQVKPPEFIIDEEKEKEINLHAERPDTIELKGRVVYQDHPDKPVSNAIVSIYADEAQSNRTPQATTDTKGRFSCERPYTKCIAYVANEDRTYGAITRIGLEQKEVEIKVQPKSQATGRLMSSVTDEPLPGEEIRYGVKVYTGEPGNSPWMTLFGGSALTATDGSFTLKGLLPGFEYEASVVTDRDGDGHPRSWRTVGHVELDKIGNVELGDLELSPGYKPLTLEERIESWFANDTDLAERVQSKLRDARLGHQHLMAMITFQDHPFCSKFFETKYDFENPGRKRLYEVTANFEMFAAQPPRLKKAAGLPAAMIRLGQSLSEDDSFVLAVFSETGELLGTARQAELETDGELDLEQMYAFLNEHNPDLPDAQAMVEEAFAKARRENKGVLWQESGAFCGPCILLSRYLDKHRQLIEKDYVWVKVDSRYEHGQEMVDKYRSEEGGIPWFVIMDADGKPLISSTSEEGNIGYPSSQIGRTHFGKMLRETAQRLTDDEINELLEDLKK